MRLRVALLAAAFAALAALVAAGSLTGLDQWSVDHLMPGASFSRTKQTTIESIVPLLGAHWHPWLHGVAEIWTLPASVLPSLAVAGAGWLVLWRRGRRRAALAWAAAWVAGTAIEVLSKETITRPALSAGGVHVVGFDHAFPSGHTARSVLVAATIAVAWPASRIWVAAWAAVAIVLTELAGFHTPSDVAGGLVLAALLVELARQ
ncbi:MAG TPA: phosphatase PAP2 family protein [Gaiellaceae bacterium]|nr:phosphatase PAP2 family protein [Gaiellaceae bacterium]